MQITVGMLHYNGRRWTVERKSSSNVIVTVMSSCNAAELRQVAVERHILCNPTFTQTDYDLCYPNGNVVQTIPGTSDTFTLQGYKDFMKKPYSKLTLYLRVSDAQGLYRLTITTSDMLTQSCLHVDFFSMY